MILRQSDASRCPGLQTPHADSRRTPRERFSPSPLSGRNAASQFNVEYRAADATACPHLVLAAVARAGLEGVQAGLVASDRGYGPPYNERRRARPFRPAPFAQSLQEALAVIAGDKVVSAWFTDALLKTYHRLKRREIALLDGLDTSATLDRYVGVY